MWIVTITTPFYISDLGIRKFGVLGVEGLGPRTGSLQIPRDDYIAQLQIN